MTVVRFAPSPTGFLHLGSARTAIVNWLYARHTGGKFLLRVEDTDQVRSDAKFLEEILEDLKWMGLDWDGEPIYQSKRFDVYKEKAESLLAEGKAYKEGDAILYKVEKGRAIEIDDEIHGKIVFNTDEIKDQVMMKSDGSPAYNFCCVVDDVELGITHTIRGDDHISNTPKQILFYEALGEKPPKFAHMPLMMGADGAKLSKRHGAVSIEEYKKDGFLPEAMANYLMLLGWSPGEGKEVISLEEAVKIFELKNMSDVQARFDDQKLRWFNAEYIKTQTTEDLYPLIKKHLDDGGITAEEDKIKELIELYKVRIKTTKDFVDLTRSFFTEEYPIDEKGLRKYIEKEGNKENLKIFAKELEKVEDFTPENIETVCRKIMEEKELKAAQIIHPTRMAISGRTDGAGLFEMMQVLGKEKVLERMKKTAVLCPPE
ncbi:MAG: glutamate--tRNA ligase [Candidatus Omnitrophica bacterium]|nr:glutamate--tRNA ligase [Candidatus Omnitrophota bacterium]